MRIPNKIIYIVKAKTMHENLFIVDIFSIFKFTLKIKISKLVKYFLCGITVIIIA